MSSVSRPPRSGALAGVVASFWVSVRPEADGDEVVLPSGRAQLVVDGGHGVALLVGPRTRPATVSSSTFAAGMSLSGAGLRALSRVPVPELVDVVVDADVVIERGRWAQCLEESDPSAILDRLEHEALRHLRGDCALSQQVASAERAIQGGSRIDEVMSALGADRRRLVPAFRDAVGLAPKHYQRIQRFQRALRAMRMPTPPSLAEIAATCRYADQAHMSRDFKSFSGLTPSRLHGATSSAHNHIPTGLHAPE
ncbi:helix-turn-helix domain-containing protein [Actinospongicola halichondriae]|uniref:helix-turn-helix domain-containing protein n=1 Tax=Actinospongicola halichondriae TaxID=3236844 RepID=UPI003D411284